MLENASTFYDCPLKGSYFTISISAPFMLMVILPKEKKFMILFQKTLTANLAVVTLSTEHLLSTEQNDLTLPMDRN